MYDDVRENIYILQINICNVRFGLTAGTSVCIEQESCRVCTQRWRQTLTVLMCTEIIAECIRAVKYIPDKVHLTLVEINIKGCCHLIWNCVKRDGCFF